MGPPEINVTLKVGKESPIEAKGFKAGGVLKMGGPASNNNKKLMELIKRKN
jgi:hypothetical protein